MIQVIITVEDVKTFFNDLYAEDLNFHPRGGGKHGSLGAERADGGAHAEGFPDEFASIHDEWGSARVEILNGEGRFLRNDSVARE